MLVGIALCLTLLVMCPVWQEMYTEAYVPFEADQISLEQGLGEGKRIISQFMLKPALGAEGYPHYLHVMFILFVLNVCIMLLIGRMYPMERSWAPSGEAPVDMTPWPVAKPLGLAVIVIVLSTYLIFR